MEIFNLLTMERLPYYIIPVIFFVSIVWVGPIMRGVQLITIGLVGIWTICTSTSFPIFGILVLIMLISLAYVYEYLQKYAFIKLLGFNLILYIIFYFTMPTHTLNVFIRSAEWLAFVDIFIYVMWIIFKDSLEQVHYMDIVEKNKCLEIIKEANKTSREAIEVANIAINTMEKFEDSIKKGEPNGK